MGFGWRRRIAGALDRVGVLDGILRARARAWSPWFTVLTYHRVQPSSADPFDRGVVDATPEALDLQLGLYRRYFTLVTLDDVVAFVRGGTLPPNPLLVTFDDGYRDNIEHALPILDKHGVRATFFIATRYVDERSLFWWDRIAYTLGQSTRDVVRIDYPSPISFAIGRDRVRAIRAAHQLVKDTYDLDVDRYLDALTAASGVGWSREAERRFADELLMSWDDVRALRKAGHDVQSHTRTHRVLQTLPSSAFESELAGSRADLERELGEPVRAIAYPVGAPISELPDVRRALERAGYEIGFSNASGVNPLWRRPDPFDVRRLAIDAEMPSSHFRGMLALPALVSHAPLIATNGRRARSL